MRPVSTSILVALLLAMCGLCTVQWWRESALREMAATQRRDLEKISALRDDLNARMKNADSEILRLNMACAELRTSSVAKQVHEEALQANAQLRENIEKQNAAIKEQNELLAKHNAAILQANENIKNLASERDSLAKRLNDAAARYNELAGRKKAE